MPACLQFLPDTFTNFSSFGAAAMANFQMLMRQGWEGMSCVCVCVCCLVLCLCLCDVLYRCVTNFIMSVHVLCVVLCSPCVCRAARRAPVVCSVLCAVRFLHCGVHTQVCYVRLRRYRPVYCMHVPSIPVAVVMNCINLFACLSDSFVIVHILNVFELLRDHGKEKETVLMEVETAKELATGALTSRICRICWKVEGCSAGAYCVPCRWT